MEMQIKVTTETSLVTPAVVLPRPKGRNLRWAIVAVIGILTLTNYLDRGNLSVAAPLIMQDLHISNTMIRVIFRPSSGPMRS